MNKHILMTYTEPSDDDLQMIMRAVAIEAKQKVAFANKMIAEKIKLELEAIIQKFKRNHV